MAGGLGLPPISLLIGLIHSAKTSRPRLEVSVNGFGAVVHTGICCFRFILLEGAHEMVDFFFPVAATHKSFLFFIVFLQILIVSDQVLLPSDLLFKDCFSSHTH